MIESEIKRDELIEIIYIYIYDVWVSFPRFVLEGAGARNNWYDIAREALKL